MNKKEFYEWVKTLEPESRRFELKRQEIIDCCKSNDITRKQAFRQLRGMGISISQIHDDLE